MNPETKTCQNCKNQFVIEPDDFAFYQKIQVPPPSWCPECRAIRRMTWRNEMTLYRRKCAATGKDIVSMFAPEIPIIVYERDYWWSDKWDDLVSGRGYDFTKPFFVQFRELLEQAPLPNLANDYLINTDYANHSHGCKNCYLIFASADNENISYANGAAFCKDSLDLYITENAELCYEDLFCTRVNSVFFSYDAGDSIKSSFLRDCKNLSNCLACVNLRSRSNHLFNKPYSSEEFKEVLKEIDFGSYRNISDFRHRFEEFSLQFPRKFTSVGRSVNVVGDNITDSKNCHWCFDLYGRAEDSKFIAHAYDIRDSYDGYGYGANSELLYEGIDTGLDAAQCKLSVFSHRCTSTTYTYICHSSSNLFGCVGLKKRQYCILNKQYTKEEYEKLVPKIIDHMNRAPYVDKKGRVFKYGEFFPPELSPFAYNESVAQQYFNKTKAEVLSTGYRWRDPEERHYDITIKPDDLPDHIKDVGDSILKETIGCAHQGTCNEQYTTAFKIISPELQFYKKMNLPLPRLCPNCRHYQRLKQRNPLKLWHRKCTCAGEKSENGVYTNTIKHFHGAGRCPNEFETSYAPERPEIVYCEQCYNAEVV